ncbi:MAG: hypothetical protein KAS32_15235 [Candidatus Peribacteraceae bacterium]|nr:hypothetical protein [Candidatus Peribacteraceae bacterium]
MMSRSIKYKAYHKTKKRMRSASKIDFIAKQVHVISARGGEFKKPWEFCDIELLQTTALMSRDGKEIYEGDIVEYRYDSQKAKEHAFCGVVEYHSDKIIEIGWEHNQTRFTGFILKCRNRPQNNFFYSEFCHLAKHKVVGNIYENPELLR